MLRSGGGDNLTNVNGTLFFTALDSTLWKSDGSHCRGMMLAEHIVLQARTTAIGARSLSRRCDERRAAHCSSRRTSPSTGAELWKSDGTGTGTELRRGLQAGLRGAPSSREADRYVNGTLFFAADDGDHGSELWRSDGTARGHES